MLLELFQIKQEYTRASKTGKVHTYFRNHEMVRLRCDCCGATFERRMREMSRKRLAPGHVHVCTSCDQKKFAQQQGVESRRFWNTTVDQDINL